MAGHALRGVAAAGLVLVVVETIARDGSGRVGSFFTDVNGLVQRAFSPDVPLIPDRRTGSPGSSPQSYITPAQAAAGAKVAANLPAVGAITDPNGLFGTGLSQYVNGGGLPAGINGINPNLTPIYPVPAPGGPGRYAN